MATSSQPQTIQIRSAQLVTDIVGSPRGTAATTGEHSAAAKAAAGVSNSGGAHSPEAAAALKAWKQATGSIDGMLGDFASQAIAVEARGPDQWIIVLPAGGAKTQDYCESPARKEELQAALARVVGRTIQFNYRVQPGPAVRVASDVPISPTVARSQRLRQLAEHPLVSKLCELLQGEVVRVDPPTAGQISAPHSNPNGTAEAAASPEMVDAL